MVDTLSKLNAAADLILESLAGPPVNFIMGPKYLPFDRVTFLRLLLDFKIRCQDSVATPPLSSPNGGVKRGPGAIASPTDLNPRLAFARLILVAWKAIHGDYPGSRHPEALEAAEALFQLSMESLEETASKNQRPRRGEDPLTAWRKSFEAARSQEPILGPLQEHYLRSLREALEQTESSRVDSPAFDETAASGPGANSSR